MKKFFPALLAIVLFCMFPVVNVFAGSVSETTSVSTIGAEDIDSFSAVLKGHVTLQSNMASDIQLGFRYSTTPVISSSNSSVIEMTDADAHNNFTATVTGLKPATKYYFLAFISINGLETRGETMAFTTLELPVETAELTAEPSVPEGAVDMGIVITRKDGSTYNLYWAECNVGASKPEEYGNYYAWGETELKIMYNWKSYRFRSSADTNDLSKYVFRDGKDILDPEDDVAHVTLGGNWRMPTEAEWAALLMKCVCIWTDNYNGTGVKGMIITASNGNSIFLPASGSRGESGSLSFLNSEGRYWSSSVSTVDRFAAHLFRFISDGDTFRTTFGRIYGVSVRPVTE